MSALPGVTERAASLLQADPTLARAVGLRAADERALSVLAVSPGAWRPPAPAALGSGTIALVVLEGLLAAGSPPAVVGPGDVIEPWNAPGEWTACTAVRLAIIGSGFMEAVRESPAAAERLLARAQTRRTRSVHSGPIEDRLLALLWRIAGRWGDAHGDAIALPRALDAPAVATLLELGRNEVAAAVRRLAAHGAVVRRDDDGWLLRFTGPRSDGTGYSRERRDELRARSAQQIAVARAATAQHATVAAEIRSQLAHQHRRRAGRG